jgi:hypothetical protein
VHRDIFINALQMLYSQPTLGVKLPSAGRVNLLHQAERGRYVAHLLYAPPQLRGKCLVIEDMPPLYEVAVELRVAQPIVRAWLAPQGQELALERGEDSVRVVVPKVEGHQAVVFDYGKAQ